MPTLGITDWFSEGNLALQVFRVIAVIGLIMALLQVMLRMMGFDHHEVDFSADGVEGHGGSHAISWTTLSGFTLGFGCVGSLLLTAKFSIAVASIGGALSGLGVGAAFFFLMRAFNSMREDNTFDIRNCIGQIGTAYIRIPAHVGGGQIQVVAQSRMVTLLALSDEEIASGEKVKVVDVIGNDTVKVERAS